MQRASWAGASRAVGFSHGVRAQRRSAHRKPTLPCTTSTHRYIGQSMVQLLGRINQELVSSQLVGVLPRLMKELGLVCEQKVGGRRKKERAGRPTTTPRGGEAAAWGLYRPGRVPACLSRGMARTRSSMAGRTSTRTGVLRAAPASSISPAHSFMQARALLRLAGLTAALRRLQACGIDVDLRFVVDRGEAMMAEIFQTQLRCGGLNVAACGYEWSPPVVRAVKIARATALEQGVPIDQVYSRLAVEVRGGGWHGADT